MTQDEHTEAQQLERWQAAEEAGSQDRIELRQKLYGAATRQMLEAAHLKPGDHVLDIAAGTGDQSREAARLIGPEGRVLATDISQEMLDVAARLGQQEGLDTITTRVMNAEQLDLPEKSYNAVISRLGLMLIPRKQQALREIWRVLRPGGRLAALVWSKPERNPLFAPYVATVAKSLEAVESEEQWTDPFSLVDATLFASMLTEAGFQEVQMRAIALTFHFPSFEALTNWWGTPFYTALARSGQEQGQCILEDVRQTVHQFERPQGIVAPAELLLGVGVK